MSLMIRRTIPVNKNDLFTRLLPSVWEVEAATERKPFLPAIDVHETQERFTITVELPGIDENNVELTLTKDALTISGEKKEVVTDSKEGIYRKERTFGKFSRTLHIAEYCVDAEKAEAQFANGLLTIVLPKLVEQTAQVRKIEIKKQG